MRELVHTLLEALAAGRSVACCRLVETRGSTPQKSGAAMLVFADGKQAGTLGGGCVEADVRRQALAALRDGRPIVARFLLDSDTGWDDGLICGGRMHVLIDPVAEPDARQYYQRLAALAAVNEGFSEVLVFDAAASGLPATAAYLFDAAGSLAHGIRGPLAAEGAPPAVARFVSPLDERPRPLARGGLALLPSPPRCRLLIVGGGHVGQAVGRLAAELDFDVWVVDDRQEFVSAERFPRAERRLAGPIGQLLPSLEISGHTYCLIVTRGHHHDEEALLHLADRGAAYVGMIGSRRKVKLIFDDLLAEGISPAALQRIHAPVGLDIGSQTVAEIAVSIAAELVAHRNQRLDAERHGLSLSRG